MKNKLQAIGCFLIAAVALLVSYGIYQQRTRISVPIVDIDPEQWEAEKVSAEQAAARVAAASRARKWVACEVDEDCVIVDKHPCGCLAGPQGVTAINVAQIEAFDKTLPQLAEACPDGEPSTQAQCSLSAQAVCRERTCTIIY